MISCLLLSLLLFSCANTEKDKAVASDIAESATLVETIDEEGSESAKIPTLNFSELEAQYLQPSNDQTTYVINFWATWCKPCVKELPYFEQLNAEKDDVKVILVSLDFPENIDRQVVPFIEKYKLKSEVVLLDDPDANSWIPKVDANWTGAIPATIIMKNNTKKFFEKSFTYTELETEVQSI